MKWRLNRKKISKNFPTKFFFPFFECRHWLSLIEIISQIYSKESTAIPILNGSQSCETDAKQKAESYWENKKRQNFRRSRGSWTVPSNIEQQTSRRGVDLVTKNISHITEEYINTIGAFRRFPTKSKIKRKYRLSHEKADGVEINIIMMLVSSECDAKRVLASHISIIFPSIEWVNLWWCPNELQRMWAVSRGKLNVVGCSVIWIIWIVILCCCSVTMT